MIKFKILKKWRTKLNPKIIRGSKLTKLTYLMTKSPIKYFLDKIL